jgi:hypothetical protein
LDDYDTPPAFPPASPAAPVEFPVTLSAFAAELLPRTVPLVRNGAPVMLGGHQAQQTVPGHPDEAWLKLLRINHGLERRTPAQWRALIDSYREQPAYQGT